jgi:signal transduction protein with GAF and PtsI domain
VTEWEPLVLLGRTALGAVSCSVALVVDDALHYVAASGRGADGILGVRLPLGRGIAGYAAASGQTIEVDQVTADPRFARDVAERTGYVPGAVLVAPIVGASGDVLGVLSILDRDRDRHDGGQALQLAGQIAGVAAVVAELAAASGAHPGGLRGMVAARTAALELLPHEARFVQRIADALADRLDDRPADRPVDRPADGPDDGPGDRPDERPDGAADGVGRP